MGICFWILLPCKSVVGRAGSAIAPTKGCLELFWGRRSGRFAPAFCSVRKECIVGSCFQVGPSSARQGRTAGPNSYHREVGLWIWSKLFINTSDCKTNTWISYIMPNFFKNNPKTILRQSNTTKTKQFGIWAFPKWKTSKSNWDRASTHFIARRKILSRIEKKNAFRKKSFCQVTGSCVRVSFFFFFVARIFGAKWLSKPKSAWNSRVRYEFWEKFIASIWFLKFCSRKKFDLASIAIIKSMGKAGAQRGVRSKIEKFSKFFEIFFWSQNDIKWSKSDVKWKIKTTGELNEGNNLSENDSIT